MARLKDMLEPGERVVLRFRPIWPLLFLPVAFAALVLVALTWAFYAGLLFFVTPAIFPAVILLGIASYAISMQPIVTDRRVLWRRSILDPVWADIRIADIAEAHFEINMAVISGQERGLAMHCTWPAARALMVALGHPIEGKRGKGARLKDILAPGEVLVASFPPALVLRFMWSLLVFLYVLGFAGLLFHHFTGSGDMKKTLVLALVFHLIAGSVYPMAAGVWARMLHWRLAVTDRRILRNREFGSDGFQELPVEAVEAVRYDTESKPYALLLRGWNILLVRGRGAAFDLLCDKRNAERIIKAIASVRKGAP